MTENMKKLLASIAVLFVAAIPRTVAYLPLAFAIGLIRLHQKTGYEQYLDLMVGGDVASRNVEGTREAATWGGDLQVWTNARLSYWSDLLSVSLSPDCLTWVIGLAACMALAHIVLDFISRDLNTISTADGKGVAMTGSSTRQLHKEPN